MEKGNKTMIPDIPGLKYRDNPESFLLIAGPCVIESDELVTEVAEQLDRLSNTYRIPFIFKSSYRKANRSGGNSFKGIGDIKALEILSRIRHFSLFAMCFAHDILRVMIRIYNLTVFMEDHFKIFPGIPFK